LFDLWPHKYPPYTKLIYKNEGEFPCAIEDHVFGAIKEDTDENGFLRKQQSCKCGLIVAVAIPKYQFKIDPIT